MYTLNEKIRDLVPYEPNKEEYPIKLDSNESFLRVPEYVMAEVIQNLQGIQFNRYPDPTADVLCANYASAYGLNAENVVAGNGSDELINIICNSFLMAGEKYGAFSSDFSMYSFYAHLAGAKGVFIPQNNDFTVDVDRVIETCKAEEVRMLIFSNPCNPTSLGLEKDEVRRIITSLPDTLIVLDEAYMDFWDQSLLEEVTEYDNLIILKTLSKAFGLAAVRCGFAVANERLIRVIKAVKSPFNVNTMTQVFASTLLKHKAENKAALRQIKMSTEDLQNAFDELSEKYPGQMEVKKSCTNFITVKMPQARDYFVFLKEKGILIRFYGPFIRVTAGNRSENAQLIKFTEQFLEENK
ncbi:MAG: histidinol-phosphate transaminase [Clostridia bacterium]|nr:histidinol-phosphate transaminase [Clostridia bacterium]